MIEKIAELIENGKLSSVADVRDESAEDIRIVIEPKSRVIDDKIVMAQLFSLTELESKFALNMNVLDKNYVPRVMNLKEVLQAYVDHRVEVLTRRIDFRLNNIAHRLEILEGYLITYLNIDEVIHIIREFDDAKSKLMEKFNLSEVQADAILNMRLRSLRKLEEMEIRKETEDLKKEQAELLDVISSDKNKLKKVIDEVKNLRAIFSKNKELSSRLSLIDENVEDVVVPVYDFTPKEPITIILSSMGWIKYVKNHIDLGGDFSFKDGDSLAFALHAMTNDKIIFATDKGQFFTLDANKIPSGRGYGEPIRIMLEIPVDAKIINVFVYQKDSMMLLASKFGYGFKISQNDMLAQTKNGKIVMNLMDKDELFVIKPILIDDDKVAVVGNNRKLLVFDMEELPVFSRGKGVILQKYKEANTYLSDVITFKQSDGLSWINGSRNFNVSDISMWIGKRASVGHMPPDGFPKSNKFNK